MKIATARVSDDVAFHEGEPIPSRTLVPIVQSLQTTSSSSNRRLPIVSAMTAC